jgi:hypothetical protein
MIRFFFIGIILFFISTFATAQVYPPNFQCVQNDTLRWESVSNPCGPFQKYLIYGSQNKTGPYIQLAAITDECQIFLSYPHSKSIMVLFHAKPL